MSKEGGLDILGPVRYFDVLLHRKGKLKLKFVEKALQRALWSADAAIRFNRLMCSESLRLQQV